MWQMACTIPGCGEKCRMFNAVNNTPENLKKHIRSKHPEVVASEEGAVALSRVPLHTQPVKPFYAAESLRIHAGYLYQLVTDFVPFTVTRREGEMTKMQMAVPW